MPQNTDPLIQELCALVLEASQREAPADGLRDDEVLFGSEARLDLDSLDALQISMAIQKKYGLRMADSKDTRRALASLATLAAHLRAQGIIAAPA